MRPGLGQHETSLFEFARAVTPTNACFQSGVYRIAQTGVLFDWNEMTGLFNSFRPIVASAPAVHGNESFLNYIEYAHRKHGPDRVKSLRVTLKDEHCIRTSVLGIHLGNILECRQKGGPLARLLKASHHIQAVRDEGRTSLLLLNACQCGNPASAEWLRAGLLDLDANHRDLLEMLDIHFVVVGGYDLLLGGTASDSLCTVTIEPYSREQVSDLLSPTTDPEDSPFRFSFDPEAVDAIYKHTVGDKYFTNLLAASSITATRGITDPGERVRVGREQVNSTAGLLARGMLVEDRVTRPFREAFKRDRALADAVALLAEKGAEEWSELSTDVQRRLFQTGIVGPASGHPTATGSGGGRARRNLFSIRNPLMRTFAKGLRNRDAGASPAASESPPEPLAAGEAQQFLHVFETFEVGETRYRLRRAVEGVFDPETYAFRVPGTVLLSGRGATLEGALADWKIQFHFRFQTLIAKLESEITPEDKEALDELEDLIDMDEHRKTAPVTRRQIGTVQRIQPFPVLLRWEDGSEEEATVEMLPPDFLTYRAGQRFEAIVTREPDSHRMRRIMYSQRLTPLPTLTPEEIDKLWNALPTTRTLPEADWE